MDTDIFMYEIVTERFYGDIAKDVEARFDIDTSGYLRMITGYYQKEKKKQRGCSQWCNWGAALGAIAPPSREHLPLVKEYENQTKLYVDVNGAPVLGAIFETFVVDYPLVISCN